MEEMTTLKINKYLNIKMYLVPSEVFTMGQNQIWVNHNQGFIYYIALHGAWTEFLSLSSFFHFLDIDEWCFVWGATHGPGALEMSVSQGLFLGNSAQGFLHLEMLHSFY